MNPPQDPPPNENSSLHWVLCSENWKDLVIIAVPDLNTTPTDSNYLNVSTLDIKEILLWWTTQSMQKVKKETQKSKENLTLSLLTFQILMPMWLKILKTSLTIKT